MKNKIKNAWTQKEYRKSNLHKKIHYYPLTKKAKQELAELAMLENVKVNLKFWSDLSVSLI